MSGESFDPLAHLFTDDLRQSLQAAEADWKAEQPKDLEVAAKPNSDQMVLWFAWEKAEQVAMARHLATEHDSIDAIIVLAEFSEWVVNTVVETVNQYLADVEDDEEEDDDGWWGEMWA